MDRKGMLALAGIFVLGCVASWAVFGLGGAWRVGILSYLSGALTVVALATWYTVKQKGAG